MQITLPDDPALRERALAAGFATVEAYVRDLVKRDAAHAVGATDNQSNDEWIRDFRSFVASLVSQNPDFDDSRASIYPVR